jgi:glycosyltransferase involved in cell wall biosynthesis
MERVRERESFLDIAKERQKHVHAEIAEKHQKLSSNKPRVSIGMPVFNGEKYLREALDSILAQTYQDFELIISDNASTDHTQQICREYANKDSRIHYNRNEENLGAPKNYNRVFELSSGEYFKWAAYDDVLAPEYVQKCVNILDKDTSIVLCHSRTGRINEQGILVGIYNRGMLRRISSWKPHERFSDFISLLYFCCPVFGVYRAISLRRTPLHGDYIGADRNLLAEMALIGRIYEIPECLFFERDHPDSYSSIYYGDNHSISEDRFRKEMAWWSKGGRTIFPHWKNCVEYFRSVNRVRLKWSERLLCYDQIFRWITKEGWLFICNDLKMFLLYRSHLARKLIPPVMLSLRRTVVPIIGKLRK